MNDQELLRWARECTTIGGDCTGCPFYGGLPAKGDFCEDLLISALAERVEKLGEHSARYAEEIAVMQERERWISVTEALPESMALVLCLCADGRVRALRYDCNGSVWILAVSGGYTFSFPREAVTHWRPLPEVPKEVEYGTTDI